MQCLFHPDIFETVRSYLTLREVYLLEQAGCIDSAALLDAFGYLLRNKVLDRIHVPLNQFKALLADSDAILGGSIFHYLSGDMSDTTFAKSDLDIFCHVDIFDLVCERLLLILKESSQRPKDRPIPVLEHPEYMLRDYHDTSDDEEDMPVDAIPQHELKKEAARRFAGDDLAENSLFRVKNLWLGPVKFQVIGRYKTHGPFHPDMDPGHLLSDADLQICSSYYDGHILYLSEAFLCRYEVLPVDFFERGTMRRRCSRIEKYLKRNFVMVLEPFSTHVQHKALKKPEDHTLLIKKARLVYDALLNLYTMSTSKVKPFHHRHRILTLSLWSFLCCTTVRLIQDLTAPDCCLGSCQSGKYPESCVTMSNGVQVILPRFLTRVVTHDFLGLIASKANLMKSDFQDYIQSEKTLHQISVFLPQDPLGNNASLAETAQRLLGWYLESVIEAYDELDGLQFQQQ